MRWMRAGGGAAAVAALVAGLGACASSGGVPGADRAAPVLRDVALEEMVADRAPEAVMLESIPIEIFEVPPRTLRDVPVEVSEVAPGGLTDVPVVAQDAAASNRLARLFESELARLQEAQDAAPENIRLTFHIIQAGPTDEPVDPAIEEVVAELRQLFRFEGYRLLTNSVLNGSPRMHIPAEISQQVIADEGEEFDLDVQIRIPEDGPDGGPILATVRLRAPKLVVDPSTGLTMGSTRQTLISASVSLRDGQTVLLGSGRASPEDPVLILAMTTHFDPGMPPGM